MGRLPGGGSAAGREERAGSAPAAGCRPDPDSADRTTAPLLQEATNTNQLLHQPAPQAEQSPLLLTVNGFQFVIPEDERVQLGPGGGTKRWRPLQAIVAQV